MVGVTGSIPVAPTTARFRRGVRLETRPSRSRHRLRRGRQATPRGDVDGLADAYRRRFPNLPVAFDPVEEWGGVSAAIVNFGAWFQANWPKRVTTTNEPAFAQFSPSTGELVRFTIDLSGPAKTSLLALLDAIVAAFTAA